MIEILVAGERCDHVVTEMYGMMAFLKQRGQDFQSHGPQCEVVVVVLCQIFTCPSDIKMFRNQVYNQ